LIIISAIISSFGLKAEYTADSAMTFADLQYSKGNFSLALKEYQRVSFQDDFNDPYLNFKLGNCYLKLGNWDAARNCYDQVIRQTGQDSLLVQAKISKISSLIQEGSYQHALIDLFSIPDSVFQGHEAEVNLLFAITYFGLEKFDTSRNYFLKLVPGDPEACSRIDSLFSLKKQLHRPNPKTAYALSLIIPGLGQMYAGGYAEGLNSFFLNEALILLGVYVAYEYNIIDAIFAVIPWYQRYYMGGLDNAKEVAVKQRQKRRSRVYRETLDIIRESESTAGSI
jgi:tetratricopeptide (TPR) repeat protein